MYHCTIYFSKGKKTKEFVFTIYNKIDIALFNEQKKIKRTDSMETLLSYTFWTNVSAQRKLRGIRQGWFDSSLLPNINMTRETDLSSIFRFSHSPLPWDFTQLHPVTRMTDWTRDQCRTNRAKPWMIMLEQTGVEQVYIDHRKVNESL